MRAQFRTWLLVVCAAAFGCGQPSEPPATTSGSAGGAHAAPPGLIAADALTRCAEFTPARAAAIVGAAPADLTDYSRTEGRLRMCHYREPDDPRKAVSFTLVHAESVEKATASMKSEREGMGSARAVIDRVTGSGSKEPAVEDVSAIGDEAFYSPLNDAIMLRVRNVIVQVTAPADMTLKRRAAEEIVRGLRQ